jgi:hypothetical protein
VGLLISPEVPNACPRQNSIPSFPHADVTSNLDPEIQRADHRQGGGGIRRNRGADPNSFVVKILTSKPLGLKILQGIFAEPCQSRLPKGWGGTFVSLEFSRNETDSNCLAEAHLKDFLSRNIHNVSRLKSAPDRSINQSPRPNEKHVPSATKGTHLRTENRKLRTTFRL